MSDLHQEPPALGEDDAQRGDARPVAPNSMMEQLRKQHQDLVDSKETEIPLPGYNGMLVAKYRVLSTTEESGKIGRKVMHEFNNEEDRQLWGTIDAMIASCVELFYNDGEELKPLAESIGPDEPPVRYDERLREFLNLQSESARDLVYQVFGGNEPMILRHGMELSNWMTTQSKDATRAWSGGM